MRKPYKASSGKVIPSVTTILGRFTNSAGLMHWAWQKGVEGKNHREETNEEAKIGTAAHRWILDYMQNKIITSEGLSPRTINGATIAFAAFKEWYATVKLAPVVVEQSMVSNEHQYGGTPDFIGEFNGTLVVIDWKSSNGVYVEHLLQVAAYAQLWNENQPKRPVTCGYVCHLPKTEGRFPPKAKLIALPDLTDAWEMFYHLRRAYDLDKKVTPYLKK